MLYSFCISNFPQTLEIFSYSIVVVFSGVHRQDQMNKKQIFYFFSISFSISPFWSKESNFAAISLFVVLIVLITVY